jgi:hypothetical protein
MTKHTWRINKPIFDLLEVGATNAARSHANQKLAYTDIRNRHVLRCQRTFAAINSGAHHS